MKPLVAFVTGIVSLERQREGFVRTILADSLRSMLRQSDPDLAVVVTVERGDARRFRIRDERIHLVESWAGDIAPGRYAPGCGHPAYEAIRIDKGLRLARAIVEARRLGATWIAITDADELIHSGFVEWLRGADPAQYSGFVQTEGIAFDRSTGSVWWIPRFNRLCGSCFIIRADLFDFQEVDDDASAAAAVDAIGYQYVTRLLGSHLYADKFFDLVALQKRFACYHLGTGFNTSNISAPARERLTLEQRGGKMVDAVHLAPYWNAAEMMALPLPLALA